MFQDNRKPFLKVDFKLKFLKRDKEGHIILLKEEIHQGKITIVTYM
jgi:hypothetical protein